MHTTSADHSLSSEKCVRLYRPACHTIEPALAGWLSWLERFSTHRKTAVSIPGQDPCLSCGLIPRSGVYGSRLGAYSAYRRQPVGASFSHRCFSLSFPLSLKAMGKKISLGEDLTKNSVKRHSQALAGVAQWIECWPVNQRVASHSMWGARGGQPHIDVLLPVFLPLFPFI